MPPPIIKTSSWFQPLPDDHQRVGISRGTPRRLQAGYRIYRALAPGPWFNSVAVPEYNRRYRAEILGPLDPRQVADDLLALGNGRIPVLLCYERAGKEGDWCHRAIAAEWLAEALGIVVPEFGFESLPQHEHPLMPWELRRAIAVPEIPDVTPFIGWTAEIAGEALRVARADPDRPGRAIIAASDREFSTGIDTLRRHFRAPA
jgi:hypothetical protein